jgi:hypothetical protein
MMRSSKKSSKISGRWHITAMEGWGEEYLNMEFKGFIDFNLTAKQLKRPVR